MSDRRCHFCRRAARHRLALGEQEIEYCDEGNCRARAAAWCKERLKAAAKRLGLERRASELV